MALSQRMRRLLAVSGIVAALGAVGTGVTLAASDDDATDSPITGTALGRASHAALAHTGGGTVTGTEVGDEESYYEVEVTLGDGRQVDVQLDRAFRLVGTKDDGTSSTDDD